MESSKTRQSFGVDALRDEVRRLNRNHFWRLGLAARTCDHVARRYHTLLQTDPGIRDVILAHCPTSLFAVHATPCATDYLWAAKDDLVDHLVTARDVARQSPTAAAYVFGVPEKLLADLKNRNMQAIRELADTVHLDLRWSLRDYQAVGTFVTTALRSKTAGRTFCLADTTLVMSSLSLRHLNRPDLHPHPAPDRARSPAPPAASRPERRA